MKRCIANKERRDDVGAHSPESMDTSGKEDWYVVHSYRRSSQDHERRSAELVQIQVYQGGTNTGSTGRTKRSVAVSNPSPDFETKNEVMKRACPHVREVDGVKRCIGNKERDVAGSNPNQDGELMEDVTKRACQHVREIDGATRCIGSKEKRSTAMTNETFWLELDGCISDTLKERGSCGTCVKKVKEGELDATVEEAPWVGLDGYGPEGLEESGGCETCPGKLKERKAGETSNTFGKWDQCTTCDRTVNEHDTTATDANNLLG